jgi:enamine deaminase RidA (YjgF/YER057c/UK114 family)
MTGSVTSRLAENGIRLGPVPAPAGVYTASLIVGDLLFISGQVAVGPGGLWWAGGH